MTDSDFRNEDDAPTADKPRMASKIGRAHV